MSSPPDRAWSEGYKAGTHNRELASSPYKKGMMQQAWHQGWRAGIEAREAKDA